MNKQRLAIGGLAGLLALSFLMPWINVDLGFYQQQVSGAALLGKVHQLLSMVDAASGTTDRFSSAALVLYVLELIPVLAAHVVYLAATGRPSRLSIKVHAAITGAVSLLLAGALGALVVSVVGSNLGAALTGNGYGLTLLSALALLVVPHFLKVDATIQLSPEQQAQLRAQGGRMLTQNRVWLSDRQTQATRLIEERQVQGVLGRTLSRDLLLQDDRVLASRGSVITHALIEQARAGGVLPMLLSSAETAR